MNDLLFAGDDHSGRGMISQPNAVFPRPGEAPFAPCMLPEEARENSVLATSLRSFPWSDCCCAPPYDKFFHTQFQ